MSTYHVHESPFGRFAVGLSSVADDLDDYHVHLDPIGDLEEAPMSRGYLDHAALEAEARRREPDTYWGYLTPSIGFVVNRKRYRGSLMLEVTRGTDGERRVVLTHWNGIGEEVTDAARRKITEWARDNLATLAPRPALVEGLRDRREARAKQLQKDIVELERQRQALAAELAAELEALRRTS